MTLNVDLAALLSSASHAAGQGEDLAVGHMSTDSRLASAEAGWQGSSASALSAKLVSWGSTSAALLARISDHAQGLQTCAVEFSNHEDDSRSAFDTLAGRPSATPE